MGALDIAALVVIFIIIILIAAVIVALGTLPGKIASKRGHPHPDAVNAASWIGLATGVFWPLAFIWAFLPVPGPRASSKGAGSNAEVAALKQRLAALEATNPKVRSQPAGDAS